MAIPVSNPIGRTGKPLQSARVGNQNGRKHGAATGGTTPEWRAWKGMRQRCNNPNNPRYPLYGGRGIKVCDRWQGSFQAFLEDMGERPAEGWSLDRIDVNGNYERTNCRWANQQEQCRNQRRNRILVYEGVEMTMAELCEKAGVDSSHIRYHIGKGRTADEAVAMIHARRNQDKGKCQNGHEMTGDNLYVSPKGGHQCKACRKEARQRSRMKAKAA